MGVIAVCCLLVVVGAAPAAGKTQAAAAGIAPAFDAYIDGHAANGDFPGVVLVSRDGRRIYQKTVGSASLPFRAPNGLDSRFLVASVTKTFTAAGIAFLQDQSRLKTDDGLELYLPGLPAAGKIKPWHLLAHQSGLDNPN